MLACYDNLSSYLLPYLHDRPLTLRRMPDGIHGNEFYEKQAPAHTPEWMPRAYIEGHGSRGHIDFLMAQDAASLLYVANLGAIEMHPMHARQQRFDRPDYLFFDLDPFPPITFPTIRRVALVFHEALTQLGLTSVAKISGATGIVIYVPLNGEHTYPEARAVVERLCRLVNRSFPDATTMAPRIADRAGKVYLDHAMVSEGRNIASIYSMRPTIEATIGMPVTWIEMRDTDVTPEDFTIRTVWDRFAAVGDLFAPMRAMGTPQGHSLDAAIDALGIDRASIEPANDPEAATPRSLASYQAKRDFDRTAEPAGDVAPQAGDSFLINKHHARRLHYDLRLERGGVLVSWAVPKGLPREPNIRHLAVQTEDHPLTYAEFEGSIPEGEYGAGESRIYDRGRYELLEWIENKKATIRLHGARVEGEYHLVHTKDKDWMIFRSAKDAPAIDPPKPPRLEVMLASDGGEAFDDPDWMFEVKWDGVRTLVSIVNGEARLTSRRGRDVTTIYPELAIVGEQLNGLNALIDAEVVVLGDDGVPSFERIQRRFTSSKPSAATCNVIRWICSRSTSCGSMASRCLIGRSRNGARSWNAASCRRSGSSCRNASREPRGSSSSRRSLRAASRVSSRSVAVRSTSRGPDRRIGSRSRCVAISTRWSSAGTQAQGLAMPGLARCSSPSIPRRALPCATRGTWAPATPHRALER